MLEVFRETYCAEIDRAVELMLGSCRGNLARSRVDRRRRVRIAAETAILFEGFANALLYQNPHLFQTTSFELCQTQESSIDQTKNLKLHSLAI